MRLTAAIPHSEGTTAKRWTTFISQHRTDCQYSFPHSTSSMQNDRSSCRAGPLQKDSKRLGEMPHLGQKKPTQHMVSWSRKTRAWLDRRLSVTVRAWPRPHTQVCDRRILLPSSTFGCVDTETFGRLTGSLRTLRTRRKTELPSHSWKLVRFRIDKKKTRIFPFCNLTSQQLPL